MKKIEWFIENIPAILTTIFLIGALSLSIWATVIQYQAYKIRKETTETWERINEILE